MIDHAAADPRVWNSLPTSLRAVDDYTNISRDYSRHILLFEAAAPSDYLFLGAVYKVTVLGLLLSLLYPRLGLQSPPQVCNLYASRAAVTASHVHLQWLILDKLIGLQQLLEQVDNEETP